MRTPLTALLTGFLLIVAPTACEGCRKAERDDPPPALDDHGAAAAQPEQEGASTSPLGSGTPVALDAPAPGPASGRVPLVPPPGSGALRVRHQGCVTTATEAAGGDFPARGTHRAPGAPPSVKVHVLGRGVIVTHDLDHACCLAAEVSTDLDEGRVTVVERLVGEPCRCRCGSTLKTAVGLDPGTWEVLVRVEAPGATPIEAHRAEVLVR